MMNLFLEQVHNCVRDFYLLNREDNYTSKKIVDKFFDDYSDIISLSTKYHGIINEEYRSFIKISNYGYEIIDRKNLQYVLRHLEEDKEYFDNLFKDVDPNITLDVEQRKAILIDEDYSSIVAGAGSGKTTTMAAKVKYLIEKKNVNPKSIIMLSFTNSSVNDLNDLINNKFGLGVEVLTFHKLGMKFLRETFNQNFEIISDAGINSVISEYFLNNIFKNKECLKDYKELFSKYLILDDECLVYDSYDDYYKNYIDRKYENSKNDLANEIFRRKESRKRFYKTINGEAVKSVGELNIANYLYINGINYKYEQLYPFVLNGNRSYKPDFTIMNFDTPIYVEFYGLATIINNNIESDSDKYKKEIYLKRATHRKNKTDLIELYDNRWDENKIIEKLDMELKKRNVPMKKRTAKEVFYRLLETSKTFPYTRLIKLFRLFINIFKEKNLRINDFDKLIFECSDDNMKKQLRCIKDVYSYYQSTIHKQYKIDFQDMIHYAYSNMERLKNNNKNINYNYVLIDEYQDISYQRYSFSKKISDLFNAKIVAVGDDWQAIYSFSGSDIELFTKFKELLGYDAEIKITNTYRNSQELIDLAGDFILKDNMQMEKKLHSNKHLYKPVKIVEYEYNEYYDNLAQRVEELVIQLYSLYPKNNILLLSRFNSEIDNLINSGLFCRKSSLDYQVICKKVPKCKVDFMTVHKSKGLGYDRVILLNGIEGTYGFPSQIKDEPIIKYLKGDLKLSDDDNFSSCVKYPEERRLFYVALTRTKNELYIMTPSLYKYKSDFIKEIENHNEAIKLK